MGKDRTRVSAKKSAIVTGYSSGLGAVLTAGLLDRGWHVTGVSRSTEPEELHDRAGDRLRAVHGSVAEQQTAEATFDAAMSAGELKLVISCAGQGVFGPPGVYSADEIGEVMAS